MTIHLCLPGDAARTAAYHQTFQAEQLMLTARDHATFVAARERVRELRGLLAC